MTDTFFDSPQPMGVTGDTCGTCNSTSIALYALSCHESDKFHCRTCLTKAYHASDDDIVRCPYPSCARPVGFKPLASLADGIHLNNDFFDEERIDKIRQQPEVMNNLIAFTSEEAEIILHHIHSMFEDQIMDPVALSGVPGHITAHEDDSLQAGFNLNPFVAGFLVEMKDAPKTMATPYELDEEFNALLFRLLHQYNVINHSSELFRWEVDMTHEEAVLEAALENYRPVKELKENWELIIKK